MKKTGLMMSCALGVLAVSASGAYAATAAASASSSSESQGASTVSEIIVTAERREQSIQTVPVAVTAFTGQDRNLKGIASVQDMTNFTPGFTYSSQLDRPAMRGVSRNNNVYTSDSAVAVYLDDFYSNSTFFIGRDDLFIDRVEIDLGPQGTLYGRNAVGGLINTITKRPTDVWSGELREVIGNYGYFKTEGTVSGPITDNLSFRFGFFDENQSRGWLNNLVPGTPSAGGIRHDPYIDFQLEYKTDKDDLWLDAYGITFNNDRGGPGALLGLPVAGQYDTSLTTLSWLTFNPNFAYGPTAGPNCIPGDGCFGAPNATGYVAPLGPVPGSVVGNVVPQNPALTNLRNYATAVPVDINVRGAYDVVVHFTHHFDGADLRYVGGYAQYRYNLFSNVFENDQSPITQYQVPLYPAGNGDCAELEAAFGSAVCHPLTVFPASRFQYETETKWTSQEINLVSTTNKPLQWIVGGYFYNESDNNPETWNSPDQPQIGAPVQLNAASIGNFLTTGAFLPAIPNPSQNYLYLNYQDGNLQPRDLRPVGLEGHPGRSSLTWRAFALHLRLEVVTPSEETRVIDFTDTVDPGHRRVARLGAVREPCLSWDRCSRPSTSRPDSPAPCRPRASPALRASRPPASTLATRPDAWAIIPAPSPAPPASSGLQIRPRWSTCATTAATRRSGSTPALEISRRKLCPSTSTISRAA